MGRTKQSELVAAQPSITGVRAAEPLDENEVYARAVAEWEKTRRLETRRQNQVIKFHGGPVCVVFLADQHVGDDGTDYPRMFQDAQVIAATPGMWAITVGDVLNQFVIGKLRQARDQARLNIPDEWALTRRYLRLLAPKLLASVAGNHDNWTTLLTGLDYFREVVGSIRPDVLYDADDAKILLKVGSREWPGRIRHQWSGKSIYNPTHGIERLARQDGDFVWGIGGHTHASGVCREFNNAGSVGMAGLCGSYKTVDAYARKHGFARPNGSAAIAILFDETTGSMTGFSDLGMAAWVMNRIYHK